MSDSKVLVYRDTEGDLWVREKDDPEYFSLFEPSNCRLKESVLGDGVYPLRLVNEEIEVVLDPSIDARRLREVIANVTGVNPGDLDEMRQIIHALRRPHLPEEPSHGVRLLDRRGGWWHWVPTTNGEAGMWWRGDWGRKWTAEFYKDFGPFDIFEWQEKV